ncbi:hypothetical protein ACFJGV_06550 [Cnuibacter sp. UC19_7]|uniref:hypothetical protein n=1 Tax=Cnuibacter sp. UC19_7 TaxID=3350166 RepID=UPI00366DC23D
MSFAARLTLSIVIIVISLAMSAVVIISVLDNGPGWLHFLTYIAGGLLAFGIGSLASTLRSRHATEDIDAERS